VPRLLQHQRREWWCRATAGRRFDGRARCRRRRRTPRGSAHRLKPDPHRASWFSILARRPGASPQTLQSDGGVRSKKCYEARPWRSRRAPPSRLCSRRPCSSPCRSLRWSGWGVTWPARAMARRKRRARSQHRRRRWVTILPRQLATPIAAPPQGPRQTAVWCPGSNHRRPSLLPLRAVPPIRRGLSSCRWASCSLPMRQQHRASWSSSRGTTRRGRAG
jgi:hypothetical protein